MSDRYRVEHDAAGWHVYDIARQVYTLRGAAQVDAESHGPHANATNPGDAGGYRFEVWTWYQQPTWADPRVGPSGWELSALCTSRQQAALAPVPARPTISWRTHIRGAHPWRFQ